MINYFFEDFSIMNCKFSISIIFVLLINVLPALGHVKTSESIYILENPINNKFYYIAKDKKLLYRSAYDHSFSEGLALVDNRSEPNGKLGFIDINGNMIIDLNALFATSFSEGLAAVRVTVGKWGYIDKTGKMVIERYDERIRIDLEKFSKKYSIDSKRIVLMGYSLGGDLSWALCKNNASMFKKAIISGSRCGYSKKGSIVELAKNKSRFYIAVGANENKDRIKGTKKAKTQLDNAAIKNKYYTIPNAGHDPLPKSKFKEALDFVMFN